MTYVVSNLHGCADQFKRLLKEIRFTDNDVMYVLGDIVDIGEQPIELLCDLSMRYNVIHLLGEGELRAYKLLSALDRMLTDGQTPDPETLSEMARWMQNGGAKTIEGFKALDADMREGVLEYLSDMTLYEETEIRGRKYLMVHAGIADFDADTPLDDYMPEDFVTTPIDPEMEYLEGVTVIAGHVPTYEVSGGENGKIYHGSYAILVDCGAAFGEPLGCLRLEDGKEFYVS